MALTVPILLNVVAMWKDIGTTVILQILRGTYSPYPYNSFGIIYNPLPEIFLNLLLHIMPLSFLAWLMVFLSNKQFFKKQPLVLRVFETLLTSLLIAGTFAIVTGFLMPLAWLTKFHDYLLGLPGFSFTRVWSGWVVFPITAITLFLAVFLPGNWNLHTSRTA